MTSHTLNTVTAVVAAAVVTLSVQSADAGSFRRGLATGLHFRRNRRVAVHPHRHVFRRRPRVVYHAPRPVYVHPQPVQEVVTATTTVTAAEEFSAARRAFRNRDYGTALNCIDRALKLSPRDFDLHQFRSLVLFAAGDYDTSAVAVYTALTLGPGWNWNTVWKFYAGAGQYEPQYRALQRAAAARTASAEVHFLLAYHELMLGHLDAGRRELNAVLEIKPDESLTVSLLSQLPPEDPAEEKAAAADRPGVETEGESAETTSPPAVD